VKTIYNIQFARAFAALLVVYAHLNYPGASFGQFGVDIFFVISGFIMTMICHESPRNFLVRRVVRIAPLYWLVTTAVYLLSYVRPDLLNSTTANFGNFLKSVFFIPYVKENGTVHPMLDVGWTLNYEMYFYLAIGSALLFSAPRRATLVASAGLTVIFLVLKLVSTFAPPTSPMAAVWVGFYGSDRIFEFIAGVGVYYYSRTESILKWGVIFCVVTSILCIVFMTAVNLSVPHWETAPFLSRTIPSALFVISMLALERRSFVLTKWTILGDASYALYLTNEFVVEGTQKIGTRILHLSTYSPVTCAVIFVLSELLAVAIFLLVEKPMHDWMRALVEGRRKSSPKAIVPVRG